MMAKPARPGRNPERKQTYPRVKAATAGAGIGVVTSGFVLWIIDNYLLSPHNEGDVPGPVTAFVVLVITMLLAWLGGTKLGRYFPPEGEGR